LKRRSFEMSLNFSIIKSSLKVAALCGVGLTSGGLMFHASADQWDKMTLLTIDQPIQVNNTVLEPGKYMFKLANSDRHIVQIFTSDRSHLIDTILAIPDYRLQVTSDPKFTFWETPTGKVSALKEWFYPGDNYGQEFRYPKNLRALNTSVATPVPAPAGPPAVIETAPQPAPPPPPVPVAAAPAPAPVQNEPVEVAQATPPPPPAPQAEPPAPPAPAPAELPKTASPFPLIGLGGTFSLALFGLLRLKLLLA
jgi:hypothetical protein